MRYIEWVAMFIVAGLGICLANFVGFMVSFLQSLPGVLIMLGISLVSVWLSKVIPLASCNCILLYFGPFVGLPVISCA